MPASLTVVTICLTQSLVWVLPACLHHPRIRPLIVLLLLLSRFQGWSILRFYRAHVQVHEIVVVDSDEESEGLSQPPPSKRLPRPPR